MVRFVTLFLAVMFVSASPAFAQSFKSQSSHAQPPAVKLDLSAKAAGLDRIEAPPSREAGKPAARSANSTQAAAKKSIWKGPWPYVAIAAAVVVLAISLGGGYGTPGDGY